MNLRNLLYRLFRLSPIKRNRVLFMSYYGAQYGCNPKYISEDLVESHGDELEVVWAFTDPQAHSIPGVRKVKFASSEYLWMLATSRVIVTNYRMTEDFVKRKGQVYIQTWHSSMRLKKIEGDTEDTLPESYVRMAKHDSAQTDYVIAGSGMSRHTFEKSFWYDGEIIDCGTPRNDLLFKSNEKLTKAIKENAGIGASQKVLLYAPTFRKDKSLGCYDIDIAALRHTLSDRFGGEWVVALRLHPHLLNCRLFTNVEGVFDFTSYDDIQELLAMSDVLISDYSSLMFDFALTKRPVFLFASDVDDYCKNDRALYFNIEELPFPLARDNKQLKDNISSFDSDEYISHLDGFLRDVDSYEHGRASEAVTELIMDILKR